MNKFAERLPEARKEKDMLQETLAEKLAVIQSTVSGWERGKHEPSFDMLLAICKVLDCDPNYLLGFSDL